MHHFRCVSVAVLMALTASVALAEDWVASRLRGGVLYQDGGEWIQLARGRAVPDGGVIRTTSDGRAELVRGQERISLGSNTEIAIRDTVGQNMTSVIQSQGSVTIEAERRNVQHFSIVTPVLAAVVKGTQFTVTYNSGEAVVSVARGVVQAQDSIHDMVVDVSPGQTALASQEVPLDLRGPGAEHAVFLIEGHVVPASARDAVVSGVFEPSSALDFDRRGDNRVARPAGARDPGEVAGGASAGDNGQRLNAGSENGHDSKLGMGIGLSPPTERGGGRENDGQPGIAVAVPLNTNGPGIVVLGASAGSSGAQTSGISAGEHGANVTAQTTTGAVAAEIGVGSGGISVNVNTGLGGVVNLGLGGGN